ncbi:MAG: hypothetical protein GX752_02570 [Clostridium sp.]|nr:hypothetical protein [Clostridium sp.]
MKACRSNNTGYIRVITTLFIILIITVFSFGCSKKPPYNRVISNLDSHSLYSKSLEEILPTHIVEQRDNKAYFRLDAGETTEAFEAQAIGALERKIAKNWYPHYLATVVIAVDRSQTDLLITSWRDLYRSEDEVSFFISPVNSKMLIAAMAYGLEGKDFTLKKPINLMKSLNEKNLLNINSFDSPILICYDYQAVNLFESGRNIEIIIPKDGTLTYEKGLLSNQDLNFKSDADKLLVESKLRTLDGKSSSLAYPSSNKYSFASKISDYEHFARTTRNASCLIERNILNSKRYMSIDNREHLHFALIYIIIITIWISSIILRSMQKGISYSAFFTGIILIGWIFVRLVKYQTELTPVLTRYLWYGFYIFQLTLPLVLLWMAWAIDKPENKIFPPKWWRVMVVLIGALIIVVFTNDLHGFVLDLDLNNPNWDINYGYGFAYYVILSICMINLSLVFLILIKKSTRNPRKNGIILPAITFIMFIIYNYKYIVRDPFIYATDLTIITGLFTMLMFEVSIRSGLIPVNTKYIELFKASPLEMQIINKKGELVLSSIPESAPKAKSIKRILVSGSSSILRDDESVLFSNPIPGGYALWYEDISKLYELNRKIKKSTEMLIEANSMLIEEQKIKKFINEKNEKKQLMEQLEIELAQNIDELTNRIKNLPYSKEESKETTRIALLLCYIKRKSSLFFKEKETDIILIDQLISYKDELVEIAKYSDLEIKSVNKFNGSIDIRYGTLIYDFFYELIDLAIQKGSTYIIESFESDENFFTVKFLPSHDIGSFEKESKIFKSISDANGKIIWKNLEDTIGISLSFPKGEGQYD